MSRNVRAGDLREGMRVTRLDNTLAEYQATITTARKVVTAGGATGYKVTLDNGETMTLAPRARLEVAE